MSFIRFNGGLMWEHIEFALEVMLVTLALSLPLYFWYFITH